MNRAPFFFALVMAAFGVAGCGGTAIDDHSPDLAGFVEQGPPAPDLAKICVSSCTADTDCQNSCPSPSSGISCCDTTSGTCYTNNAQICPAPPDMAISSSY